MNRLKGIIYDLVLWLATCGLRKKTLHKKLLIVRVDEIGDFMLWHNFIKELTTTERFRDHEMHFCGNKSWQSLFNVFDSMYFQQIHWLEKVRFKKKMGYRYRFLREIYKQQYDIVINPAYSRDKRNDDAIVKASKAAETIGMVANLEAVRPYEVGYDRHLYTTLFNLEEKPVFDLYRNKLFTEFITLQSSAVRNTQVATNLLPPFSKTLPEKYFVVFPGSRSKSRIWPTANFITVSNYLFRQWGYTVIVCGAAGDMDRTNAFCAQCTHPCIDLTGQTSLLDLLAIFKNAQCLLSVDTGSVHLAAAVGCRVYGIFNGGQYKRFAPYPPEVFSGIVPVYPDEVETELKDPVLVKQKYEFVIDIPFATVSAEKVIAQIAHATNSPNPSSSSS